MKYTSRLAHRNKAKANKKPRMSRSIMNYTRAEETKKREEAEKKMNKGSSGLSFDHGRE